MLKNLAKLNTPWTGLLLAVAFLISGTVLVALGHTQIGTAILSALVGLVFPQPFRLEPGDE